jgi:phosphatidylglycerophosphatase A
VKNTPHESSPRGALLLASGFGLGYMPIAPGTWGSLGGVALYLILEWGIPPLGMLLRPDANWQVGSVAFLSLFLLVNIVIALLGVWTADVVCKRLGQKDPGLVVIDEVSGQLIALLPFTALGWMHIAAAFFLFRALDIWKPFPARQAESLPGGWGIMTDDWIAGGYAAAALWLFRWFVS